MEQNFWEQRWREGRIGFHLPAAHPSLVKYAARLGGDSKRVLVPLCGKSLDLVYLASCGFEVVGVEFVEQALHDFFASQGVTPEVVQVGPFPGLRHGAITLLRGDFFQATPGDLGLFDALYDRAALVAIEPGNRERYLETLARLCRPGGSLLAITLEIGRAGGPPFSVTPEELRRLCAGHFSLELLQDGEPADAAPFQAQGVTAREQVWAGRRSP